ncbi:MAG: Na/Pi symporter [Planctomycetota bacterium]
MATLLSTLLGGVGLFLLGMTLLTDGLKALAGDSLRTFLARFTGGRLRSVAAGAAVTALVQSSSATTLASIGFVSAGLLTFPQALGVILGANLGTTSTSWLVSLLGFKLSVSKLALPLIGVGALVRLLGGARLAQAGLALAGFGAIFLGIDFLQEGMRGLPAEFDLGALAGSGWAARAVLVAVGALTTVIMQSSSAAVATTLTALHAGSLDLTQAAALVIGQNVGTTVTAGLGSIGAATAAKRTALAHVLFNVLVGLAAFLVLPLAVDLLLAVNARLGIEAPEVLLAEFHTAFNLLGVLAFLPLLGPFAALLERLVPERGPRLTRFLGPVVAQGPVALEAAGLTLRATLHEAVDVLLTQLAPRSAARPAGPRLEAVARALTATREFLAQVRTSPAGSAYERHLSLLHALDHLERLGETCLEKEFLRQVRDHPHVESAHWQLYSAVDACAQALERDRPLPSATLERASQAIAELRRRGRPKLLMSTAEGALPPARASKILETVRWLDRLAYHLWRASQHLSPADPVTIPESSLPPSSNEDVAAET